MSLVVGIRRYRRFLVPGDVGPVMLLVSPNYPDTYKLLMALHVLRVWDFAP